MSKIILQEDIEKVRKILEEGRTVFKEEVKRYGWKLEAQLSYISNYFNKLVPELEQEYLTEFEIRHKLPLPDEMRVLFYEVFPEHGLNVAKERDELFKKINGTDKVFSIGNRSNDQD